MADTFRVHVEGDKEVELMLARLSRRVGNLQPLMREIGAQLEGSVADNFKGGHDPYGVPWLKSRRAKETGGKTLIDSAILRGSISSITTPHSVEVGTNVVYARRHNQGGSGVDQISAHRRVMTTVFGIKLAAPKTVNVKAHSRKSNTPKRQFLGLAPHDLDDIAALVATHLGVDE